MSYDITPSTEKMTKLTEEKGLAGKVIKDAEAEKKYCFLADSGSLIALGDTVDEATEAIEKLDLPSDIADDKAIEDIDEGPCEQKVVMAKTDKGIVNYHLLNNENPPAFQIQIVDQKAKKNRPFFKLAHNAITLINEFSCHDFKVPAIPKGCEIDIYEPVVEEDTEEISE